MLCTFDADRHSPEYPELLRMARKRMRLSQLDFGEAAGHSGVMQGRYETDRSKSNSATPSEKTARAIRKLIESSTLSQTEGAPAAVTAGISNVLPAQLRSLKSVTANAMEQAIASAISALIGAPCTVSVSDVTWSGSNASDASISLRITLPR